MTCPTCGCAVHEGPRTWAVVCSRCGAERWPHAAVRPNLYVCARCKGTSIVKREAARAAAKQSVASRRRKASSS